MSTITSVSLWKDSGYTEGCTDIPRLGSSLPEADIIYNKDFNPSTAKMFSSIQIKDDYVTLMDMSYIAVNVEMNNSPNITIYGWIDSVTMLSDTAGFPNTQIDWHIDYWRTYASKATYGSGVVMRRTLLEEDSVPPQPYSHRYVEATDHTPLTSVSTTWWVILTGTYDYQTDTGGVTRTTTKTFPVSVSTPDSELGVGSAKAPSLNSLINGTWDEKLGLDPATVFGVFLSPVQAPIGTITQNGSYAWYEVSNLSSITETSASLPTTVMTTDTDTYYVTGFDGEVVGALPWGFPVKDYKYRLIIESTSAYIQLRFDGISSRPEGLCFTLPLIPLELTENSWSSYVYSGQRQTDIESRRIQAEKSAVSGGISAMTSAVSGGLSGAMMGAAVGGPVGAIGGAVLGAGASAVTGIISTVAEQSYLTGTYDSTMQTMLDYQAANQADGLLMAGTGFDVVRFGQHGMYLTHMVTDAYSKAQRDKDIELYGVHVSEPMESCADLIQAGGPLLIEKLVVGGPIPVEAKAFIRTRLSQGARII